MDYDLAAMIRRTRNPRRTKIVLRQIEPTATMAGDLYRTAYQPVIQAWQAAIATIAARYDAALPVRDANTGNSRISGAVFDLDSILAAIEDSLQSLVISLTPRLQDWSVRAEQWHRGRWRGAVLAGTGIDPSTLLGASDTAETVSAFVSRNVQLIRSVSDDTRAKVADVVLRGYSSRTPLRTVAKEMAEAVDMSRKRALRISVDQNAKIAARLDQARQEQAGITTFEWKHSLKRHPRPWHQARDGKDYDWATRQEVDGPDVIAAGDGPGEPPFCGCRSRAVIDLS